MLTVNDDAAVVEQRLAEGGLACPACGGVLAGWGWARRRRLREEDGRRLARPRRARCAVCGLTHVLLPAGMLARRADSVEVVGKALEAKASGLGARPISVLVGRPLGTVRGWLRRFAAKAELLRAGFIRLLVAVAADPVVPDAAGSVFADAFRDQCRRHGGGRPVWRCFRRVDRIALRRIVWIAPTSTSIN